MRDIKPLTSVLTVLVLAACGASDADSRSGDCTQQIKYGETTYSNYSFTQREGDSVGDALLADCDDRDDIASGFTENSAKVGVVSFSGYAEGDVLGVPEQAGRTAVFVRDTIPVATKERIYDELD